MGKHGRWGQICALPDGHETSMGAAHCDRNSEGRGSAPANW
ncbi:hypothetical protein [Streptomyces sp. NPDC059533]